MAKTYPDIGTFTSGQILTAATMNDVGTNLDNFRVPPTVCVRRTTSDTGYNSNTDITWQSTQWDTDSMFAAGSPTQITFNTAGIYQVSLIGRLTDASLTNNSAYLRLGTTAVATQEVVVGNGYFSLACLVVVAATNTMTARILCSGGTDPRTLYGNTTNQADDQTRLVATWVGFSA